MVSLYEFVFNMFNYLNAWPNPGNASVSRRKHKAYYIWYKYA